MHKASSSTSSTQPTDGGLRDLSVVGEVAQVTASTISFVDHTLGYVGLHVPKPLQKIEQAAEVVVSVANDNAKDPIEKMVCGTVAAGAEILAGTAVGIAASAVATAAIAASIPSAPITAPTAAAAIFTSGVTVGVVSTVVQDALAPVTEPVGVFTRQVCHSGFAWAKGQSATPKTTQKNQAATNVTQSRLLDRSMNAFQSSASASLWGSSARQSSTSGNLLFNRNRSLFSVPQASYGDVRRAVKNSMEREMSSVSPSATMAWLRASSELGLGYNLSFGEFSQVARTTHLTSSYNNFNSGSKLRDVVNFCREIGGVASEVSLIEDLIDSEAHALADEYVLCFPGSDFNNDWVKQIAREVKDAYYKHKTSPFISLHFNNDGYMYPVINPSFQNTLTGEMITLLDYWMKGYLNGGIFDEAFIEQWHQAANCDETSLREHLIDLKKYCQAHCPEVPYVSLRELMNRYGVDKEQVSASSAYQQPFMTSFRIIASQEKIERQGNVLLFHPTIRVEYSIDLMPDYEKFLNNYYKEHGTYPPDYEQIRNCYEQFAEEIKEQMPKLPFCKPFFDLLGVANSYNYFFATMEKMGKEPVLPPALPAHPYRVPKSLPPIPVSYYKTHNLELSLPSLLEKVKLKAGEAAFDHELFQLFNSRRLRTIPQPLIAMVRDTVTSFITETFPGTEINEEEIGNMTEACCGYIKVYAHKFSAEVNKLTKFIAGRFSAQEQTDFNKLAISEKLQHILRRVEQQQKEVQARWEAQPGLAKQEIFTELSSRLPQWLNEEFNEIERISTENVIQIDEQINTWRIKGEEAIQKQKLELADDINELNDREQQIEAALSNLHAVLASRHAQMQEGEAAIAELNAHKNAQIGNIPGHLIALNQQKINEFCAGIDAEIARIRVVMAEIQADINEISVKINNVAPAELAAIRSQKSELVQNGEAQIISGVNEQVSRKIMELEKTKVDFQDAVQGRYRERAIGLLMEICTQDIENLQAMNKLFQHFSRAIIDNEMQQPHQVSQKYTHRVIGFTSQNIAGETKEQFRIVGGCGMSLPNLSTQPLPDSDAFMDKIGEHCSLQNEEICSFSWKGKLYSVERMSTQFIPAIKGETVASQNEATQLLRGLLEEGEINASLPLELLEQNIDASGAKLIHYAAQSFPVALFAALLAKNPNQAQFVDSLGHYPIHAAVMAGNVDAMMAILSQFPEQKDSISQSGITPLMLAVQHGKAEVVEQLLALGVDANKRLPNGLFALYIAIQNNYPEIALMLLEKVPHLIINEKLDSGMTPLHQAIEFELPEVSLALIAKGAKGDIKRKSDGYSPIHCAAAKGQLEVLQAMVASGASPHLELESHRTSIHLAAEAGHLPVVEYLLSLGVTVDTKDDEGDTPLMLAIKAGHEDVATCLAKVVELNIRHASLQTYSILALRYGMPSVADRLIERGELFTTPDEEGHDYIYHLVQHGEYARFESLLDIQSFDIHKQYQGKNLLELAAKFKQTYLVYLLLDHGLEFPIMHSMQYALYAAILDEVNSIREVLNIEPAWIPRMASLAAENGSNRCLALLLPRLNHEQIDNLQLLKNAILSGNLDTVRLVIAKCSNINKPLDNKGNTALHLATSQGLREVVELLLQSGSDVQLTNHAQQTAFHVATVQNDDYLLKRLFKLTRPSDWPKDLLVSTTKLDAKVASVLKKYSVRVGFSSQAQQSLDTSYYTGIIPEDKRVELVELLTMSHFAGALELLEESPDLINAFKTNSGGELLQLVFRNTHELDMDDEETKEDLSPRRLLTVLRREGINPALFTGSQNVLLSLLSAKNDKEACYRLDLFSEYFRESLPALVQDKIANKLTVSQLALRRNKTELFTKLHEVYAVTAQQEARVDNALHEAVLADNYDLVEQLLTKLSPDSFNNKRQTPLMFAALKGNTRIISLLINHGANPLQKDIEGRIALYYALGARHEEASLALLPLMTQPNLADRRGITPLSLASAGGVLPVVRFLCEGKNYTEQVDDQGRNALHYAALSGQTKVIEYLVQHGFDVNGLESPIRPSKIKSSRKRSALHLAAIGGHADAVIKLIDLGANPLLEDKQGRTVCEYAIVSKDKEMLRVAEELAIYHQKERQAGLLFAAVQANHLEAFDELILGDASLNVVDEQGFTLLHYCAQFNAVEILKRILIGGDIDLDLPSFSGQTALQRAAYFGHVSIIEYLLAANASPNVANNDHKTALFIACEQGHLGAVISLLKAGADFTIKNNDGLTSLQMALTQGHASIAVELATHGDKSWKLPAIQSLSADQTRKIMEGPYQAFTNAYQTSGKVMPGGQCLLRHGLFRLQKDGSERQQRVYELSVV